jgi:hypothetical protein
MCPSKILIFIVNKLLEILMFLRFIRTLRFDSLRSYKWVIFRIDERKQSYLNNVDRHL